MAATWSPAASRDGVVLSLLDHDPELAGLVPEGDRGLARRATAGVVVRLETGDVPRPERWAADDTWGTYVVHGLLVRSTCVGHCALPELLGPGELLPARAPIDGFLPAEETLTVVEPAELLVLHRWAAQAMARWPAVLSGLQRRADAQRQRAAVMGAIAHLPKVEVRLLAVLWHLAGTWGRVSPDGMIVPFPLTHAVLGRFVAAQRSTTTLALRKLVELGLVERRPDGSWLLPRGSREGLEEMLEAGGAPSRIGLRPRTARDGTIARSTQDTGRARELVAKSAALRAQAQQVPRHYRGG
jgi:CRP/FNR family transcriptional regulator, cyclic AMP receptor protein